MSEIDPETDEAGRFYQEQQIVHCMIACTRALTLALRLARTRKRTDTAPTAGRARSRQSLSLRQAATRLGVHHVTLSRWIAAGEGPRTFEKRGSRSVVRIRPADLDAYINANSRRGAIPPPSV